MSFPKAVSAWLFSPLYWPAPACLVLRRIRAKARIQWKSLATLSPN